MCHPAMVSMRTCMGCMQGTLQQGRGRWSMAICGLRSTETVIVRLVKSMIMSMRQWAAHAHMRVHAHAHGRHL